MVQEYADGNTPNPDILCNREIKFDVFLKYAMKLNADFIATGHYCRKKEENGIYKLIQGKDKLKDQTNFLSQIKLKISIYGLLSQKIYLPKNYNI